MRIKNEKKQFSGIYCDHDKRIRNRVPVWVTGKYAVIIFHSDDSSQKKGFFIRFVAVDEPGKQFSKS